MKTIYLLIIGIFLSQLSFGQSISPAITTEFCPNVETTFTVTIPGPFVSISPADGSSITLYPTTPTGTTFTFKGKFGDFNQTQKFKVV